MGRVGRVGRMDGHQKCPLIFFILRYEDERQGPDRRQPFLENSELFNLFTVSWPRKEGRFTRVFLRRGLLSRQYPENE